MSQIQINSQQMAAINENMHIFGNEELTLNQRWLSGNSHLDGWISRDSTIIIGSFNIAPDGTFEWAERKETV